MCYAKKNTYWKQTTNCTTHFIVANLAKPPPHTTVPIFMTNLMILVNLITESDFVSQTS